METQITRYFFSKNNPCHLCNEYTTRCKYFKVEGCSRLLVACERREIDHESLIHEVNLIKREKLLAERIKKNNPLEKFLEGQN